ncbi:MULTISPECIES: hypothetical protein [Methylobacterium]|nr:hypothetical protein [Methylobacterium sp. WL19]
MHLAKLSIAGPTHPISTVQQEFGEKRSKDPDILGSERLAGEEPPVS